MDLPSGDHDSGDAGELGGWLIGMLHAPQVKRRAPAPSVPVTQRCAGRGAEVNRKSLFPTSNESLNRSSPVRFWASSDAAYAIMRPSGRHANCCTPAGDLVTCK